MSQFRFKDYIFKNLLPFFFQNNDSYRDEQGKGILERFMEICSGYFDTEIIDDATTKTEGDQYQPGLDNILNLIDVEKTPELFLNYIWEFLGEIPYAYGLIVQGQVYNKEDLEGWMINNEDFPQADPRKLLKYCISLYKIRGTARFYDILGEFYGVNLSLVETSDGGDPGDEETEPNHDHLVLATYTGATGELVATYARSDLEIRAPYPDGDCTSCLYFILYITMSRTMYEKLEEEGHLQLVKDVMQRIVERYLPIHCRIAHYNSGEPKIIINVGGDFNDDFNDDFNTV